MLEICLTGEPDSMQGVTDEPGCPTLPGQPGRAVRIGDCGRLDGTSAADVLSIMSTEAQCWRPPYTTGGRWVGE
jgi:hypothetical protein